MGTGGRAISFSWCGNIRSEPPPWISSGYPAACSSLPNIQCASLDGRAPRRRPARFALFRHLPQNESIGLRLSSTTSTRAPACSWRDPDATARHMSDRSGRRTSRAVVRHISVTFGDQLFSEFNISAIWCVARGSISGRRMFKAQNLCAFRRSCDPPAPQSFRHFIGAFDDFVVDIGNVAHILRL